MAAKKPDSTSALVAIMKVLEPLGEEDRGWVLQSAANRWKLSLQQSTDGGNDGGTGRLIDGVGAVRGNPRASDVQVAIANKDPRAFIRLKKPASDVQRVACLGYYLVKTSGQPGFSSKDVAKAHTDSGGSQVNLSRALDNATRAAKYLSNRGPGVKQLTTLGEDVVEAMPDPAAVKAVENAAKMLRRGRKKGKTAKKV